MFCVDGSAAEAIRRAFDEGGELSAVVELRRHFPGIIDNANARRCARVIAGWTPMPPLTTEGGQGKRLHRRSAGVGRKTGR
jgi:hypothetical protein